MCLASAPASSLFISQTRWHPKPQLKHLQAFANFCKVLSQYNGIFAIFNLETGLWWAVPGRVVFLWDFQASLENPKPSNTYLGEILLVLGECCRGLWDVRREAEQGCWWGWCLVWQRKDWLPSWLGSASGALKSQHTIRDKPPNFFRFTHLKKQLSSKNKIKPRQMNKKTRQMLKENEKNKGCLSYILVTFVSPQGSNISWSSRSPFLNKVKHQIIKNIF